jgi:hypothetical protein
MTNTTAEGGSLRACFRHKTVNYILDSNYCLNSLKMNMHGIHLKGIRGKLNLRKSKNPKKSSWDSILLLATHVFLKNFSVLSVVPNSTTSWCMRITYTSKGVMKILGCTLSIEKYNIVLYKTEKNDK